MTNQEVINTLIAFSEWITENGYVTNKDELWYKPSVYPRIYLKDEQLIEQFYDESIVL